MKQNATKQAENNVFFLEKQSTHCYCEPEAGAGDMKKTSIRTIASALELSAATVSRALSDSPLVAPETRRKILESARELGYRRTQKRKRLMVALSDRFYQSAGGDPSAMPQPRLRTSSCHGIKFPQSERVCRRWPLLALLQPENQSTAGPLLPLPTRLFQQLRVPPGGNLLCELR